MIILSRLALLGTLASSCAACASESAAALREEGPLACAGTVAPSIIGPLGFENGIVPSSANNGWYVPSPGQGTIVDDGSAHGGKSFRNAYVLNPGSDQGTAVWAVFDSMPKQRVYARMRYKQDPSFDNSGIKKLIRFQGPSGLVGGVASLWGRFAIGLDGLSQGENLYPNVGREITPDQLKGGWHWLELMADFTTPGVLRYRFWIDGTLQMDYSFNRSSNGATIYIAQFNGTWNAPGGTSSDWMDDLAVSTECIGSQ